MRHKRLALYFTEVVVQVADRAGFPIELCKHTCVLSARLEVSTQKIQGSAVLFP